MKDKKLLALIILGGLGVYYFMNRPPVYSQQFQYIPPPPPSTSPTFQAWVDAILKTFGAVAALWAPGGPFYNQPGAPPPPGGGPAGPGNPAPGGVYGPAKAAPLLFLLPGV